MGSRSGDWFQVVSAESHAPERGERPRSRRGPRRGVRGHGEVHGASENEVETQSEEEGHHEDRTESSSRRDVHLTATDEQPRRSRWLRCVQGLTSIGGVSVEPVYVK